MPYPKRAMTVGTALLLALGLAGCGGGEPKPDNAAIDQTLNQLIANDEAERRQLIEEARAREELREKEMANRSASDGEEPD